MFFLTRLFTLCIFCVNTHTVAYMINIKKPVLIILNVVYSIVIEETGHILICDKNDRNI